jgi:hypothetical protein
MKLCFMMVILWIEYQKIIWKLETFEIPCMTSEALAAQQSEVERMYEKEVNKFIILS